MLFALLLGKLFVSPVVEQSKVQPVLVDGAEFEFQCLVQARNNFVVALHGALPALPFTNAEGSKPKAVETIGHK